MIPIQVLGTGLIPRGYGLAPRLKPFMADPLLVGTIMATPGLTVNFVNPETKAVTKLTPKNMNRIIEKWSDWDKKKAAMAKQPAVKVPDKKHPPQTPVEPKPSEPIQAPVGKPAVEDASQHAHTPPAPTPPSEESKALEGKGPDAGVKGAPAPEESKKADGEEEPTESAPADEKADEKKHNEDPVEQKTTPDAPASQKNNSFRPVVQVGQNNQNKNNTGKK